MVQGNGRLSLSVSLSPLSDSIELVLSYEHSSTVDFGGVFGQKDRELSDLGSKPEDEMHSCRTSQAEMYYWPSPVPSLMG